jgi:hypothetical protein
MNRIRLSTTVDVELLRRARSMRAGITDAALIDAALAALLARHRAAEIDASYAAYDEHPPEEPHEGATWHRGGGRPARRECATRSRRDVVVRSGRDRAAPSRCPILWCKMIRRDEGVPDGQRSGRRGCIAHAAL